MQRYAKKSILRVLWRPSWISSKYYCYTCKKKWNPIFFLSRPYSEPESVAKSILTNKKSEITNGPALIGMFIIARKHITPRRMLYRARIVVESYSNRARIAIVIGPLEKILQRQVDRVVIKTCRRPSLLITVTTVDASLLDAHSISARPSP